MPIKGIDVSEYQGKIDWEKVKTNGIQYAVLRCGYGMDMISQDDSEFERNIKECERLKIPYGVYLFSYADTLKKAESEAYHTIRLIEGYKPTLGVWYDIEDDKTSGKVSKSMLTNIINTYGRLIKNAGYSVGIYASLFWLNYKIEQQIKNDYPIWVAQYYSKCEYIGQYTMWQYTSGEKVTGINGNVDANYLYDESLIKIETQLTYTYEKEKKDRIKQLQVSLNKDFHAQLIVDGIIGVDTTKVIQSNYLKYYTSGDFVKWVQTNLKRKNYDLGKYNIDARYGKDTEASVKKYQRDNGLIVDGCAGIEVVKSLIK